MVCTEEDDFTRSQYLGHTRWIVDLSDGTTVISDDDRPGLSDASWARLKAHVEYCGLQIVSLAMSFRDNVIDVLPKNAEGYLLRRAMAGFPITGETFGYWVIGFLKGDEVCCYKYTVPDLILFGTDTRYVDEEEKVGVSLIRNSHASQRQGIYNGTK